MEKIRSTTILCCSRDGKTCIAGDGQVTLGHTVVKASAKKIRVLDEGKVLCGFAGSAADGIALVERFEGMLQKFGGNLQRAAVELAKTWRTDRALRKLEAVMIVANAKSIFMLSGTGDVIEPEDGVIAIGSGGSYALAAARALIAETSLSAREVAMKAMHIAADICIYTNHELEIQEI
ncbi:MAG: ATP-dependent protease subunit HslV [Planctomycetes bacterium]|nr:ATP-dependent protease subunit HslV [Planctomycetota bacterium]